MKVFINIVNQVKKMNNKIETEALFDEYIDFDTFSKSDFRVVEILDCIPVKKSNKLLQFTINDGTNNNRIILSGIHKSSLLLNLNCQT